MQTRKITAGHYEITNGSHTVEVFRNDELFDGPGWIAAAKWDTNIVSDPFNRKKDAVEEAKMILEQEAA